MRILTFLLCFLYSQALEIQVNFGKEKGEDFSVLNLKHAQAFPCIEDKNVYGEIISITCTIPKTPINNFVPTNTAFFNLSNSIQDNSLILTIKPKHKARLFATFLDLKTQRRIPKERPKNSKQWQIIGFKTKIPFLSDKETSGLNFPIAIPSNEQLYIGQLDINLNPLHYEEGLDFKQLGEIKKLYDNKEYFKAQASASLALKTYPQSIFTKEFLLYKIRSLSHSLSKENVDSLISSALEWIKQSLSDKNAPEVLYLLANAYRYADLENEAYYYYKRTIDEYPQNDWGALSKMQLAKKSTKSSKFFQGNINLFAEAYAQAQTPKVKNIILLEWGKALLPDNKTEGEKLIQTTFEQNPQYFISNPQESFATLQELIANQSYELASHIAAFLLKKLPEDDFGIEQLAFDLGEWYEYANNTKEAHFYNQYFLNTYPNSKSAKLVASRDDQLLFKMGKNLNNDEKLAVYDSIIKKYPNSKASDEAYLKKAQLLFDLKRYEEVLKLQKFIPQSPLIAQAKKELIVEFLKQSKCKQIPQYFKGSDLGDLPQETKLALFDCLYSLSYYQDAKNLIENYDAKEAQDKLPWIYRLSKVLNKLGQFAKSREAGDDTLDLAKALKQDKYYDVGFVIFDDLMKLDFISQAQKMSVFLEEHFKEDQRILEVWYFLLKNAQKAEDQNATQIYAKNILDLQNKIKFFDYTPNVDFIYIYSLIKSKQYTKAEAQLAELLKKKIQPKELQKALYMQGSLLKSMGKEYKESFKQCLEVKAKTSWKNLCQKSLEN